MFWLMVQLKLCFKDPLDLKWQIFEIMRIPSSEIIKKI